MPDAARNAADFLSELRDSTGAEACDDDPWIDGVLVMARPDGTPETPSASDDAMGRCVDPRCYLERLREDPASTVAGLIDRILWGGRGVSLPFLRRGPGGHATF